jgi:uncharacterized protein
MNRNIEDFVLAKRVAVVGASRSTKGFGNSIATELKQRGYQVSLVHPEAKEIAGDPCYPSLTALKGQVDSVVICVSPRQSGAALADAKEAGLTRIWLQQGAESPEVLAKAKELGLSPVTNKCILMYAPPVKSLHGFHRGIMKLIGQL